MTCELKLTRGRSSSKSTPGIMSVNGVVFCHTLELPVKDGKPGSAIPPGTYAVKRYFSPHFERPMPLLMDVPGREGIEIHWLNYPTETHGCIGVGFMASLDSIQQSRLAFDALWGTLSEAWDRGEEVAITIYPFQEQRAVPTAA
jgi:hypothetical protein